MPAFQSLSPRAQSLLRSSTVWDNHGCMPLRPDASFLPQLQRYRQAGFNVVSINVGMADVSLLEHLRILSFMRQWITERSNDYSLIRSMQDIERCKLESKLGVLFDIEGMCPVQDDPSFVQTFYELGVRWMLIAYNRNNKVGGGCLDTDNGLTAIGRKVIDEMERVGMVLCLSHAGARTVSEALDYATSPCIFSHSNPHAVYAHPRNVSDSLMRRCAAEGGVIGLNGIGLFLGVNAKDMVARYLDMARYVIQLVGADHVGIGLDYVFDSAELDDFVRNNPDQFPPGLSTSDGMCMIAPEALGEICEGLARDNMTDGQIQGVLGGNWLRVARQVWK